MNSFLNPHNGTSLTGVIDLTVHSISLFQENEEPQNIKNTFIHNNNISIAEPYDVQIDETGNNFITMYQFNGDINDTKVPGLESLLNYMNENFYNKDEPAVNNHEYHVTKKQYTEETHNIYNIDKSKSYNIKHNSYSDDHHYHKKQNINNSIINNITRKNTINNTENILNVKHDYSTKNYMSKNYKSQIDYIEHNLYKKQDNITFNNLNNMYKHINNYSNDVTNNYKINKIQNLKKNYYNFTDDIIFNKTSNSYSNDTNYTTTNNNKNLSYHTNHTDFMYQRNNTKNDNRKHIVLQNHYFTFQRQYNTNHLELQIQSMQLQIEQMQAQINNLSSNNPPPDDSGIGTA